MISQRLRPRWWGLWQTALLPARRAVLRRRVGRLVTDILANSPGTNRRVKRLIADRDDRSRSEALDHERSLPYGVPEDMAERMGRG